MPHLSRTSTSFTYLCASYLLHNDAVTAENGCLGGVKSLSCLGHSLTFSWNANHHFLQAGQRSAAESKPLPGEMPQEEYSGAGGILTGMSLQKSAVEP